MSDLLLQGLTISIIGISLTFAALGILILMMFLLTRIFPPPEAPKDISRPVVPIKTSASRRSVEDEEVVAAIAAALSCLRSLELSRSGLGESLETAPGPWWVMGKVQQQFHSVVKAKK